MSSSNTMNNNISNGNDRNIRRSYSSPSIMQTKEPTPDPVFDEMDDFFVFPPTHPIICGMSSTSGGFAYRCHMSSREKRFMCQQAFNEDGLPMSDYSAWNWLRTRPDMQVKYKVAHIFREM